MTREIRWLALICGAVGLALCLIALLVGIVHLHAALIGWLAAFVLTSALPLGGLYLALMLRIVPGLWRNWLQDPADRLTLGVPLLMVLVLPVLFGVRHIFPWPGVGTLDGFKTVYLASGFFATRSLAILGVLSLLALLLVGRPAGPSPLAIAGLIAFVLLHGVLSVDWLMSLDPEFHSSGFGLYILAAQVLTAFSVMILIRLSGRDNLPVKALGPLLLTLLLLWAYLAFMQYFILWSGNLPAGVSWYQRRGERGWALIEYLLTASRLLPAFLLLFPPIRGSRRSLMILSGVVLIGSALETVWLTLPSAGADLGFATICFGFSIFGMGLLLPLGIDFGTMLAARVRQRRSA